VRIAVPITVQRPRAGQPPGPQPQPTPSPTPQPTPSPAPGPAPVIAAAGDIACDPGDPAFNGGAGTATSCRQRDVSDAVLSAGVAAVLPLGDVQYSDAASSKFAVSYGPSWGRLDSIVHPVTGNHEYLTPGASGYF